MRTSKNRPFQLQSPTAESSSGRIFFWDFGAASCEHELDADEVQNFGGWSCAFSFCPFPPDFEDFDRSTAEFSAEPRVAWSTWFDCQTWQRLQQLLELPVMRQMKQAVAPACELIAAARACHFVQLLWNQERRGAPLKPGGDCSSCWSCQ